MDEDEWMKASEAIKAGNKMYGLWVDYVKDQVHNLVNGFHRKNVKSKPADDDDDDQPRKVVENTYDDVDDDDLGYKTLEDGKKHTVLGNIGSSFVGDTTFHLMSNNFEICNTKAMLINSMLSNEHQSLELESLD